MYRIIVLFLLLFVATTGWAQDYCFAQYYLDKAGISPALVAVGNRSEAGAAVRSQWPGVSGGYKICMAEYQHKLPAVSSGIGIRICGNLSGGGAYSATTADIMYGYSFVVSPKIKCSLGIEAGYIGRKLHQDGLIYYSMIDPVTGSVGALSEYVDNTSYGTIGFGTGGALYTRRAMIALGFHHITNMVIAGENNYQPLMTTLLVNYKIPVGIQPRDGEQFLAPGIVCAHTRTSDMMMPGVSYYCNRLFLWAAYRIQKSVANSNDVLIGIGFSFGNIEISVAHEIPTSSLVRQTAGAYEAGIKYKFNKTEKNTDGHTILCPAF
jgi:type IX secretion system PorP/SprF family membrane protein